MDLWILLLIPVEPSKDHPTASMDSSRTKSHKYVANVYYALHATPTGTEFKQNSQKFYAKPSEAGTKKSNVKSKMIITATVSEMLVIGP